WPLIIIAGYQLDPFSWPYKLIILVLTFALAAASQYLIEDPLRHAKLFKVPWRAFTLMTSSMIIIGSVTFFLPQAVSPETEDRKSTRLNSSHVSISYAVFCFKKKK